MELRVLRSRARCSECASKLPPRSQAWFDDDAGTVMCDTCHRMTQPAAPLRVETLQGEALPDPPARPVAPAPVADAPPTPVQPERPRIRRKPADGGAADRVGPPAADPVERPASTPAADPVEPPVSTPAADPVEPPASSPAADPVERPASSPVADPVERPASTPAADPVERPASTPAADPDPRPTPPTDPIPQPERIAARSASPDAPPVGSEPAAPAPTADPAPVGAAGPAPAPDQAEAPADADLVPADGPDPSPEPDPVPSTATAPGVGPAVDPTASAAGAGEEEGAQTGAVPAAAAEPPARPGPGPLVAELPFADGTDPLPWKGEFFQGPPVVAARSQTVEKPSVSLKFTAVVADLARGRAEPDEPIGAALRAAENRGLIWMPERRTPGGFVIDHLTVTPNGIWLVAAAPAPTGRVEKRDVGDWFTPEPRLFVGDDDHTHAIRRIESVDDSLRRALRGTSAADIPRFKVLCFGDAPPGWLERPFPFDDVWVTWSRHLVEPMLSTVNYQQDDLAELAETLDKLLASNHRP